MSLAKHTDLSYLKQLSNGSNEFILQMISVFMEQTPKAIETIESCFRKRDWQNLAAAIHKIRPSFSFMGIHELEKVVVEIEDSCRKEVGLEALPSQLELLKKVCEESTLELEKEKHLYSP